MLGKLIKNEIKQSSRYFLVLLASAAIVILLMIATLLLKVERMNFLASLVLLLVGGISVIMAVVLVIKNFNDTLYKEQGYLTFTLPVSGPMLLFSKVLVSFFWIIISNLIMVGCWVGFFLNMKQWVQEEYSELVNTFRQLFQELEPTNTAVVQAVIFFVVNVILIILMFVSMVYFSTTVANTRPLQKHPLVFGFLIFFATYIISNIIQSKLTKAIPLSVRFAAQSLSLETVKPDGTTSLMGVGGLIFMFVISAVMLFITGYIMERKVNVK